VEVTKSGKGISCLKSKIQNSKWFDGSTVLTADRLTIALMLLCISFPLFLCGCEGETITTSTVDFLTLEGKPSEKEAFQSYYQTELKTSTTADVLAMINLPKYETLSQSTSVIASAGEKKKGYKTWMKMVAFDENKLTAERKYLFMIDERPKILFTEPWEGLRFDCQMVLGGDVLDKPYSNENAKRIAMLRQVLENTRKDIDEIRKDNKTADTCGILINQAISSVLVRLDASPAEAAKLSDPAGLSFKHTNLDRGKIGMTMADDIVTVKIRLGSFEGKFNKKN
jgi:hypothetical protein